MPEEDYIWLPREDVLTHEEMAGLTSYFTDLGVDRVRLTGGEPLLRRNLPQLIRLFFWRTRLRRCMRQGCTASRSASIR
jgi:GTP 3',8-cyclase